MYQFGIGGAYANPNGGNLATPSYPQQFGVLQDVSVEFDQKLVELRGQNKFPDDVAPGDMNIKGKAGFGNVEIDLYNALFFGETSATGITVVASNEAHTVPGTPFQVTIAPPGGGVFAEDLGVLFASTGQRLIPNATPITGQYKVTGAVYTFAAADTTKSMLISYSYTTAGGNTMTVIQHVQGYGPSFELFLNQPYQGTNGMHLYSCRASKMSAPMKRDGYLISDFEFIAYANAAGKVFDWFQISV